MPFFLVLVGLICVVTAARNTHAAMGNQLVKDFTGQKSFIMWAAAIGMIGALGYSNTLKPFSRAFLALILLALVLKNPGIFKTFIAAIKSGGVAPQSAASSSGSIVPNSMQPSQPGASVPTAGGVVDPVSPLQTLNNLLN